MAAVVSASLGAFGPLLWKLSALVDNECGRLKGVRREIPPSDPSLPECMVRSRSMPSWRILMIR